MNSRINKLIGVKLMISTKVSETDNGLVLVPAEYQEQFGRRIYLTEKEHKLIIRAEILNKAAQGILRRALDKQSYLG